jgi:Spy/CpxP family protein refolding chaperone
MKAFATAMAISVLCLSASAMQAPAAEQPQGSQAPAGQAPQGSMGGEQRRMPTVDEQVSRLDQDLNLTDAQKPKVKAALESQRSQMQTLMQDSSMSRDDKMAKMKDIHDGTVGKINDVLTDDQKTKFAAMQEKQKQRMEQQRESGTPPPHK